MNDDAAPLWGQRYGRANGMVIATAAGAAAEMAFACCLVVPLLLLLHL
jgi:tetrahydromethanopterin S-methyltransferase subunit F